MPSQRNVTPKAKNAQLSTRSVGTPACEMSFWRGNSCLGSADAIAFELDNGFGGAASLRRADMSVEFQDPVAKSRAMYWTVKDPSGRPWGLLIKANKFNKLYASVFTDNPHSLKGTLHLGFKQEGLLRRHTLDPTSQTHMDVTQTGLLAQNAFSPGNIHLIEKFLETPTQ